MFYHRSNIFNFSLILFAIIAVSKTEDYLLNCGTKSLIRYKHVYSGNGFSFCSFMKVRNPYIDYFDAVSTENGKPKLLLGYIDFDKNLLYGSAYVRDNEYAYTQTTDNKVTNNFTWFHICLVRNESFISFYFNGQPLDNYSRREKTGQLGKNINLNIDIGSLYDNEQNASFFQANVFDRSITAKEAMDMYNGKTEGDVLSWCKIISKSDDISFQNECFVVKGDGPQSSSDTNCLTTSLLPNIPGAGMSNSGDPGSSSGNSNQGSSSDGTDPGSSSGNSNQGSSSDSTDPGSSSGNSNQGSSYDDSDPGSSSGNSNQGSSSDDTDPGSSSTNPNQGSSSGNSIPGSSSTK